MDTVDPPFGMVLTGNNRAIWASLYHTFQQVVQISADEQGARISVAVMIRFRRPMRQMLQAAKTTLCLDNVVSETKTCHLDA